MKIFVVMYHLEDQMGFFCHITLFNKEEDAKIFTAEENKKLSLGGNSSMEYYDYEEMEVK